MTRDSMVLANLVRDGRLRLGLNQTDFGQRIGLSQKGVSEIERGMTVQPRPDVLMQIARTLEIPVAQVWQAVSTSAGNVSLDDYFMEGHVPPEVQASFLTLTELSPQRLRQAQEMIEVLKRMDDEEFQQRAERGS